MFNKVGAGLLGFGVALSLNGASYTTSQSLPPDWSRKSCGPVCTVERNDGGLIDAFRAKAHLLRRERVTLRIDGPCASACTMAADAARPFACVTKRAVMRFHQGYETVMNGLMRRRFDPSHYYSRDIRGWVRSQGGFPGSTLEDETLLDMTFETARRFWKVCA